MLATAPLRFEPAATGTAAQFVARGARYHFEFTAREAALQSGPKNIRLRFAGANPNARIAGAEMERSTTSLYLGNDPSKWRRQIPNYGRLQVSGLYPGVDLTYYGNGNHLEYDLMVKPGADPRSIRFQLRGGNTNFDRRGDLVSELIQKRPVAYQITRDGSRRAISSRYRENTDGSYGFALGPYDHSRELVIDPVLIVSQYFSGSYQDIAMAMGHDSKGLIYIGGITNSSDFPIAGGSPLQNSNGGGSDLFLAVIDPTLSPGSQVIYATYIGGSSDEVFGGMSVGPNGDVYMTGNTDSATFPVHNAAQSLLAGTSAAVDAFVLWIDPTQTLQYSTYFGGGAADTGKSIAVDSKGRLWIAGDTQSTDLPHTGGFQQSLIGTQNMFIAGFDPSQSGSSSKIYSIYLGGTRWEDAYGIAIAPDGTLWIAGGTFSSDIWIHGNPTTYQGTYAGDGDAYFAHIDPNQQDANALLYASFFGGNGIDEATSMVLDPSGRIILSGYTLSTNLPVSGDAFQQTYGGNTDAFVAIVDPTTSKLVYSTYFGGSGADAAFDMKQDSNGILYLSGYTESGGLPGTSNALQASYDGSLDAFGLKLDPAKAGADGVNYFTYLGSPGLQIGYAVDFDSKGDMYLAGSTTTGLLADFGGPARTSVDGSVDAFVIGFPASASPTVQTTSATVAPRRFRRPYWRVIPHR